MAYNNGFPIGYQYYQPQYQAPVVPQPQPQQSGSIIWVQGEAGAKSYMVAPNSTVQLWDSEKQTIYLKSADASGMPSMKTLDYTIRDLTPPVAPQGVSNAGVEYITKTEFQALYGRVEALQSAFDKLTKTEVKSDGESTV